VSEREDYRSRLAAATVRGARGSLAAIKSVHPGETLCAYTLVTDDDLSGIGPFACTEEWLTAATPEYLRGLGDGWDYQRATELLRFMPVDWTYVDGADAFAEANALIQADLRAGHNPELHGAHVEDSFAVLVDSLAALRREGAVASDVFLSVLSSDPSPYLLDLEEHGVRKVNGPELYRRWHAIMRTA
jgi:hypothetical protein